MKSSAKLFADNTSLFSTVYNVTECANLLNENLKKISEWAFNWKMLLNPDISKQALEVIFSHKSTMLNHPTIFFNKTPVAHTSCQKHLRMHLDEKLNFSTHVKETLIEKKKKMSKRKLQKQIKV